MDRPLDPTFVVQRDRRRRLAVVLGAAGAVAAVSWGATWLRPSVARASLRLARVDRGPIEATITATGTVVPEVERVFSSPLDCRVVRILKRPGAPVAKGEPILELDVEAARVVAEKLGRGVALKENARAQAQLTLEKSLADLEGREQIKRLQLESNRAQLARNRQLQEAGLLSVETLRLSELSESQSAIELRQIEAETRNARTAHRTQLDGVALELATLRNEAQEARRLLDLATTRSDRDGVLTWTVADEGVAVRTGEVLARVADLRSFRLEATVSDVHAHAVRPGLPATVRIGAERLRGTVSAVRPTIQNGVMSFSVSLEERSSPLLKSNLRVDVDVVTDFKESALRLGRGPAVGGAGSQDVFVVRGGRAVRVPVRLGLAGFDRVEVLEGLQEGDEVIVSDTESYAKARDVAVR